MFDLSINYEQVESHDECKITFYAGKLSYHVKKCDLSHVMTIV